MVGVAQLVEHWVVAPAVVGSNPITHPIRFKNRGLMDPLFFFERLAFDLGFGRRPSFAEIPQGLFNCPHGVTQLHRPIC